MSVRYPVVAALLLASSCSLAVPAAHAIPSHRTCATAAPTALDLLRVRQRLAGVGGAQRASSAGVIHIAIHVLHDGANGDVPQEQIDAQLLVLNQDFAASGYQFELVTVDRVDNAAWFNMDTQGKEDAAKSALAVDPAHTLNLYLADLGGYYLGWSYYPWSFPETDNQHAVFVDYRTVPGGLFVPYDLGRTATHEVGHWVGLAHTFENGCAAPGDEVDDTPDEADPAFGCPLGSDTCPTPGADPIHNYMDYSDDGCMSEFTPGQASRVGAILALYRPSLLTGGPTLVRRESWGGLKLRYGRR